MPLPLKDLRAALLSWNDPLQKLEGWRKASDRSATPSPSRLRAQLVPGKVAGGVMVDDLTTSLNIPSDQMRMKSIPACWGSPTGNQPRRPTVHLS